MQQLTHPQPPIPTPCTIAVCPDPPSDDALLRVAARLSVDLGLPLLTRPRVRGLEMLLVVTPSRLELRVVGGAAELRGGRAVFVNLAKVDATSTAGRRLSQPIAKAVGLKRGQPAPAVIDATAGYGEDAWLLASLGCRILAVERNKIVATLLRDGLLRAATAEPAIAGRVTTLVTDAAAMLRQMVRQRPAATTDLPEAVADFWPPDVIYLDPMFPTARKTAQRKALRVLRRLVGDDESAPQLLAAALTVARRRVVVKRPLHAEPLADKPGSVHKGKSTRYDVYHVSRS